MKPFIIPTILMDPWDDLDDILTASEESTADPNEDFTTPPDAF